MADKTITQLTDIGEAIADGDEIAVYNASGTNTRKSAASRLKTYATNVDINGLSTKGSPSTSDLVPIYDVAGAANKKATISTIVALASNPGLYGKSFTAQQASFPASNFAALGSVNERLVLAFDAATDESAYFELLLPYNGTHTIDQVDVFFITASATSGTVVWNIAIEAVTATDATDLDAGSSFDTGNALAVTVAGTAGYLVRGQVTTTNKDSATSADFVRIRVTRDADNGSDTASGDAYVLAVGVYDN